MSEEEFSAKIDRDKLTKKELENVKKFIGDIQKVMRVVTSTKPSQRTLLLNGLLIPDYKRRRIPLDTRWITLLCFEGD